jgi:hypothetical protein
VAYPHFILDWHEIVNEDGYSVSYCPLTGSAVCFDTDEEFGVSGLLYNNNLIMYDRPTDSYWLQMLLSSVSGDKLGNKLELINSIETTWGIWRKLFPNTLVIDPESDLKNEYHNSPYGNYSTCNTAACRDYIYFPTTSISDRFAAKDRLFAIIGDAEVKAFELAEYASPRLEKLQVDGIDHVVIISSVDNIAVAFETGRDLELKSWDIPNGSIVIAENGSDQTWDITGRTIQGGNSSENLKAANAYIAYWFAIAAFFPEAEITEL